MKRRQFLATTFLALFSGKTLTTPNDYELAAEEVVNSLTKQLSEAGYNWKQCLGFSLDFPLDTRIKIIEHWPKMGFMTTVFVGKNPACSSLTDYQHFCTKVYNKPHKWIEKVNREAAKLLTARGYC